MGEHPNVALVRELLEAFDTMDVEKLEAHLSPDLTWHMIGGETTRGIESLASAMPPAGDDFGIDVDVHDVVGNDDHVVALVNATARVGGQTFTYRTAEIYHVADGKVTERWAFSDDTEAINEFFGQFE